VCPFRTFVFARRVFHTRDVTLAEGTACCRPRDIGKIGLVVVERGAFVFFVAVWGRFADKWPPYQLFYTIFPVPCVTGPPYSFLGVASVRALR